MEDFIRSIGNYTVCLAETTDDTLTVHHASGRVGAVKVGPSIMTPQVFENNARNLQAAIHNRVDAKTLPCLFVQKEHTAERQKIGRLVRAAMNDKFTGPKGAVWTTQAITDWAANHPLISDLRSAKWSEDRVTNAWRSLDVSSTLEPSFSIKAEALERKGKAPRMLVADGDAGQMASLMVVKCFEDLLFKRWKDHCVKGRPSGEALTEILGRMRATNRTRECVEGDGSAWDTCCSGEVRGMIENPVLRKISIVLFGLKDGHNIVGLPKEWAENAMSLNEKSHWNMKRHDLDPDTGLVTYVLRRRLAAFRRSGHRGTSCLNYWVNLVLWTCSLCEDVECVLDPDRRTFKSAYCKGTIWWDYIFEGDDSGIVAERIKKHADKIEEYWKNAGFRMKLVWVDTAQEPNVMTIVGWNVLCDKHGPIVTEMMPEPMRGLKSSAWSVSPTLRQEIVASEGASCASYHTVGAASQVARYKHMAGRFPELANVYRASARWHMSQQQGLLVDRESSMKIAGTAELEGTSLDLLLSDAQTEGLTRSRCDRLIKKLGLECDTVQSAGMLAFDMLGPDDDDLLRAAMPPSWK